ncbi:alanine acetyltransferase [Marivirga lumbricoides]|uniref:Alanine acetyltransferase n=1 Tax=Marivirga lumbricoides TaxID=1046115 RepID=A0ABQ1MVW6_9BACT|nr:alanine acetyltransferase [Marivirga lumbricoides]
MKIILSTERLLLKPIIKQDAAFILKLVNSPLYIQFIGDRKLKTVKEAEDFIKNGPQKSYNENGYGLYCVRAKEDHLPIGVCGLLKRDFLPHPDIGFAFLPEAMGRGYAYEIAAATLEYAHHALKLNTVLAFADPANERSVKLLEKTGMQFQKHFKHPDEGKEVVLYFKKFSD